MNPRLDWRALLRVLTRNWFLKLASIAFAIGLWGFVNLGAREADRSLAVPLEVRNLPSRMVITSSIPDTVSVHLRGPRTILGTVDERRQRIVLDLANINPGTTSFKLDPDMLNLERGVRVTRMSPVQVTVDVEQMIDRVLPVTASFGTPPNGFRVVDADLRPTVVRVSGPKSIVNALKNIPTGPLHLDPTRGTFEEFVPLERPADLVQLSVDRVLVRGRLEEAAVTQEFRNVEIGARRAPEDYRLNPRTADVTLRGPQRLMKEVRPTVTVDLEGVGPGTRTAKIDVAVPEGLEIVQIRPAEVTVRVGTSRPTRRRRTR